MKFGARVAATRGRSGPQSRESPCRLPQSLARATRSTVPPIMGPGKSADRWCTWRQSREIHMARCTAPIEGRRSASAAAACLGRYSGYRYGSYSSPSYSSSGSSGGGSGNSVRPKRSRASSSVAYAPAKARALIPIRDSVEKRASLPDLRDVFLCHMWDDRGGAPRS